MVFRAALVQLKYVLGYDEYFTRFEMFITTFIDQTYRMIAPYSGNSEVTTDYGILKTIKKGSTEPIPNWKINCIVLAILKHNYYGLKIYSLTHVWTTSPFESMDSYTIWGLFVRFQNTEKSIPIMVTETVTDALSSWWGRRRNRLTFTVRKTGVYLPPISIMRRTDTETGG